MKAEKDTVANEAMAQALLKACVDALSAHVAILDESGAIVATNAAWKRFLAANGGRPTACDVGGNYLRVCENVAGPDRPMATAILRAIERCLRGEDSGEAIEYGCHGPHERRWFAARCVPLPAPSPGRVLVAHENITERVLASIDREASGKDLGRARAMQVVGTLAGGVAHTFNNALATILGNAELALQDLGDPTAARDDLQNIVRAARRAQETVQQLVAFSRPSSPSHERVCLNEIVRGSLETMGRHLPPDVRFATDLPEAPLFLRGDERELREALAEVAANAAQSMRGRTGIIHVRLTAGGAPRGEAGTGAKGRWAAILFIDGGSGMGRAAISRVFDPFFTTKPPGEGTGLGLAVAQSVFERHGGRIELVSEPGQGTLVAIRLPLDELEGPASSSG